MKLLNKGKVRLLSLIIIILVLIFLVFLIKNGWDIGAAVQDILGLFGSGKE